MKKIILLIVCWSALFFSCKRINTSSSTASSPDVTTTMKVIQVTDTATVTRGKLLFVNLDFFKTPQGNDTCTLINTIVTEGKMKSAGTSEVHHHEEDEEMICSFLDCSGEVLYQERIANPLSGHADTFNESGKIGSEHVHYDHKEVGMRVQIQQKEFCNLKIEKSTNKTLQLITIIKLGN